MKLLNAEEKIKAVRHECKQYEKRKRRAKRKKLNVGGVEDLHLIGSKKFSVILAPERLDLNKFSQNTLSFINLIRKRVLAAKKPTKIDFSECEFISPEAALVLTAEMERCNNFRNGFVTGNFPKSEGAFLTLRDFFFYKRLGIDVPPYRQSLVPTFDIIPIVSGSRPKPGEGKGNILADMENLFFGGESKEAVDNEKVEPIYDALSEALNNVGQHAYVIELEDDFLQATRLSKKWWRAGMRDEENGKIYLMFYDQGVGIPNTLPIKWKRNWKNLGDMLKRSPPDSAVIQESTKLDVTKTGTSGRGNGLYEIKQSIYAGQHGWLRIMSNKGVYSINSKGEESLEDLSDSLCGTLITWHLHLAKDGMVSVENIEAA